MTPDPSDWRTSTDYARAEHLNASDLGWEWLRRNERYDRDYRSFATTGADKSEMTERIGERWGLRFPRKPACNSARHARLLAA